MKTNNIFFRFFSISIWLFFITFTFYHCALFTSKPDIQLDIPVLSLVKPKNIRIFSTREDLNMSKDTIRYLKAYSNIVVDSLIILLNELPSLKYLEIPNGAFFDLDKLFENMAYNDKITHLYIENLDTLSPSIKRFKNIEWLGVNDSNLEFLPKEIGTLHHLKVLNLGYLYRHFSKGNRLKVIPESIIGLQNLEILYINNNNISKIPDFICKLPKLKILSARNNGITKIPKCLKKSNIQVVLHPPKVATSERF